MASVGYTYATPAGPTANAVPSVDFDATGRRLAVGAKDGMVHIFDVSGRGSQLTLRPVGTPLGTFGAQINHLEFSPDGSEIAAGSSDLTVRVFDLESGSELGLLNNPTPVTSLYYLGDTGSIVFGSSDGFVRLWRRPDASLPKSLAPVISCRRTRPTAGYSRPATRAPWAVRSSCGTSPTGRGPCSSARSSPPMPRCSSTARRH